MQNLGNAFFFNLHSVDVRILDIEFLNVDHHFTVCILHLEPALVPTAVPLVLTAVP
jgi:hypothetical protein